MKKMRLILTLLGLSLLTLTFVACAPSATTTDAATADTTANPSGSESPIGTTAVSTTAHLIAPSSTTADTQDSTTPSATVTDTPTTSASADTSQFSFASITPVLPKPSTPEALYVMSRPQSDDDLLTAVSLQGLSAANGKSRILINYDRSVQNCLAMIKTHYADTCQVKNASTIWSFLRNNPEIAEGYILTDLGDESINVATSLAGLLNAVIVTSENKASAERNGLSCLLDVSEKDDAWLRKSDYFKALNQDIAFMLSPNGIEFLRDYAIFNKAYLFSDADSSPLTLRTHLTHMNAGFTVFGWNNNLGEHGTVQLLSQMNACMVPSDYAKNLAALSSFPLSKAYQKTEEITTDQSKKHTLCLVMSDGDNLQWVLNDFMTSSKWFANSSRGGFPFAWGLPAATVDVAAPALMHFYEKMQTNEEFIMELSGLGYTFPSKWKDMTALADMQSKVVDSMKRSDMSVLEILDDVNLTQSVVDTYYQGYLTDDKIKGILYLDYGNYAKYKGKIYFTNGKPIVTAKYRLWANTEYSIEELAEAINRSSKDPTSQNAYTFVTVHAWSGLDANGNLTGSGNCYDAVCQLVSLLDADVDIVTPTEFIERISENISHE